MKKFNLSVAVMVDDEPIMYLFSQDYEKKKYIGRFDVYGTLQHLFPTMDWILWNGQEGEDYIEYTCSPDAEREDMELLAIWQKI